MAVYERDGASLYYEERGAGFPLLLIAPGGMNSTVDFWGRMPINPVEIFPSGLTLRTRFWFQTVI